MVYLIGGINMAIKITVGARKVGNLTWKCPSCNKTLYSYNYDLYQPVLGKSKGNVYVLCENKSKLIGYSITLDEIHQCPYCNKKVVFFGSSKLYNKNSGLYSSPLTTSYLLMSVLDIHAILENDINELKKRGIIATYYRDTAINEFISNVHKLKEVQNFPGVLAISFKDLQNNETQIHFIFQSEDGIQCDGLFTRYEKGKLLEGF